MNTIKFDKQQVKVIAHRGLRGIEPENSIASFIAAGNRTYYGIESDVHATVDDWFVVIHDKSSGRVANKNLKIGKNIFSSLQELSLFNRDGSLSDLKIPTLEEYIKICHRYDKVAFLELKSRFSEKQIQKILRIIDHSHHLESTVFISYQLENLSVIRRMHPRQRLQLLIRRIKPDLLKQLAEQQIDLDINYKHVSKELVNQAHELGIAVNCWTCNNKNDAEELVKMGVDYITTDILE